MTWQAIRNGKKHQAGHDTGCQFKSRTRDQGAFGRHGEHYEAGPTSAAESRTARLDGCLLATDDWSREGSISSFPQGLAEYLHATSSSRIFHPLE